MGSKRDFGNVIKKAHCFSCLKQFLNFSSLFCIFVGMTSLIITWFLPFKRFSLLNHTNYYLREALLGIKQVSPHYPVTPFLYTYEYIAYDFSSWKAPKGYMNTEISLSKSRGYLLTKEDSKHQKVVYQLHGGAYITPFSSEYNEVALNYSKNYDDADVFSLDNRVASQAVFPAALEDALEGYEWLLEQGYKAENIVIAGDSSGGGLALSLTLKLRDEGKNLPRCLILSSPWANLLQTSFSYIWKRSVDVYFGGIQKLPTLYASSSELYNSYVSPVYGDYHDMPPMLIQTGSDEMLLGDSKIIASKAKNAGVHVNFQVYEGMWHVFYIYSPSIRESAIAWKQVHDFITSLK